jgi:hypothetical protein
MNRITSAVLAAMAAVLVLLGAYSVVEAMDHASTVPAAPTEHDDFCRGLEMYGGVDAFIEYMNTDNPSPMAPEVEKTVRDAADKC